ncbi:MAG TPA: DUF933 domain-containing protein [Candidatus Cloacimonadota bacterium]|nr:YchF family ATPase [Candidatus Cloacimonadota bacterium]HOD53368.1 DUF933 domain-containing protein [Candidatus Cloacimonadota bacterium]HPM01228.1 DUF933 domain-containing protein [Candidatus Cloacimonadota bacterium]
MKIGISGLPKSGKTTIFNALTKLEADTSLYDSKSEPNLGNVLVLDERITHLSEIYKPKSTIYANIEFIDFPAMSEDDENHQFLSTSSMTLIKNTDALAIVLRNFSDPVLDETYYKANPVKDFKSIYEQFILSDLITAEKRIEKIELGYKRGIKTPAIQLEEKVLRQIVETLNEIKPISSLTLSEDELKTIRGFQFLSQKPVLIVLNSDENNLYKNENIINELKEYAECIEFAGKFEMELSRLDEEEAKMFMEDMNIKDSAINVFTKTAYSVLGLISFFTVGTDEVRAWTIHKGDIALEAAGKIHSDLARGFIRAETFNYTDFVTHGSEKAIREKGLFRLEGKTYVVKDGDIINVRFNV